MSKLGWTPWHEVVKLREDLRSGELSLAVFAADLYDVMMGRAQRVYQDPKEFFSLTYPTYNLRELAKDVVLRLAGRNDRAVRQLELTYGGGKTHALITLFHLVADPDRLPRVPAVDEFLHHIGTTPPRARVAVLAFDKLDVEKGMEVRGPDGSTRWLRHPWSVIAYQIAGADGLRLLHADGLDAERESAPAENLMAELVSRPQREGLATLILIDEVLMYAREKIGLDTVWRGRLSGFFQCLTQAVAKVPRCAVVASLLATDPRKSDALGKEIAQELYAIFRREREEGVEPVVKEDVAEVLRRRFFTADSIRDREAFRPHVVAALRGISALDDETRREGGAAEERFLKSYPFHPDLTEVFYSKWTNLEGFQRTRGVLRTFAIALREAERWDDCPLIAANVFLSAPGADAVSEAARELTTVAATEEYEGKRQEWTGILQGELEKARKIQRDAGGLNHRELEQAVFATFLHSQPIGQRALTRDLMLLLGHTRPDRILLEKALREWAETSWFLDESGLADADLSADGRRGLPKSWRLGSKPNLTQMHHDACLRVDGSLLETRLLDEISKVKSLKEGARAHGLRFHILPPGPAEVEDDGEFHFAVLGPKAASEPSKPSAEAKRYVDQTTGPDRPRVHRNAVVLAVPSHDGLEAARDAVRQYMGWEIVRDQLKNQEIDPVRQATLAGYLDTARKRIPDVIRQAYCIVVAAAENGEVEAFRLTPGEGPLFDAIRANGRSRIHDSAVNPEALLPAGPYALWREGESSRRVRDLVGAFAQLPRLPKMLSRQAILDTLVAACLDGLIVLRLTRPDRSVRTFWRERPDDSVLDDPALEAVLPQHAVLTALSPSLLAPGRLPGLWESGMTTLGELRAFFAGGRIVRVPRGTYEDVVTIPAAEPGVVDASVNEAVRAGALWFVFGPASILGEDIPAGLMADQATLQAPPAPVRALDILPQSLPAAWSGEVTTGTAILAALSARHGKTLPWAAVRDAVGAALKAGMLERAVDSGPWPCDLPGANVLRLRVPCEASIAPVPDAPAMGRRAERPVLAVEAEVSTREIQDLSDRVADLLRAAAGVGLKFHLRVELGTDSPPPDDVVESVNRVLAEISHALKLERPT